MSDSEYTDARTFALSLLPLGLEFIIRNGRLRVWPGKSWYWLTDAQRRFIKLHRAELKALVGTLPETTVVWDPRSDPAPAKPKPVGPRSRPALWG